MAYFVDTLDMKMNAVEVRLSCFERVLGGKQGGHFRPRITRMTLIFLLYHPVTGAPWEVGYGGSTLRWIKESVGPDLKDWGSNTVGWAPEFTELATLYSKTTHDSESPLKNVTTGRIIPANNPCK